MTKILLALLLLPVHALAADDEKALSFEGLTYPVTLLVKAGKTGSVAAETAFCAAPDTDYDTVLLQGMMPDPAMRLDVQSDDLSRYELTGFHRFPNGRFWARYRSAAPGRSPMRLSITDLGLKQDSTLTLYAAELFVRRDMREPGISVSTVPYVPDPSLFVPSTAPFSLVRRAAWQAAPPTEPYIPVTPRSFTLHHTQAHYPGTFEDAVAEMQFIQDFHQHGRGWIDVGYHFLIDPLGNIFEGRPIGVQGAHVLHHNEGNIGISIMGNYHPPAHDVFTPEAQASFVALGRYIKDAYSVRVSSFYAHRDLNSTDCPGDDLYARKGMLSSLIFDPRPQPAEVDLSRDSSPSPAQSESLKQLLRYLNRQ